MKITPELSHMLKAVRLASGLTQAAVANRLGVAQPTVAGFEVEGADLRVSTLRRLMRIYGAELSIDAVMPGGEHFSIVHDVIEPDVLTLHAEEFEVIREFNSQGMLVDVRIEVSLVHDGSFFSTLTIDRDRMPEACTVAAILKVAKCSMTFDPSDIYRNHKVILDLTHPQLALILSVMNEIKAHEKDLR